MTKNSNDNNIIKINENNNDENKNKKVERLTINFGNDYNKWLKPNENKLIYKNLENEIINKDKIHKFEELSLDIDTYKDLKKQCILLLNNHIKLFLKIMEIENIFLRWIC